MSRSVNILIFGAHGPGVVAVDASLAASGWFRVPVPHRTESWPSANSASATVRVEYREFRLGRFALPLDGPADYSDWLTWDGARVKEYIDADSVNYVTRRYLVLPVWKESRTLRPLGVIEYRRQQRESLGQPFGVPGFAQDPEQIATLLDLARAGEETTFRDLARCLGVRAEDLDAMWTGTVRRVRRESPESARREAGHVNCRCSIPCSAP